MKSFKASAYRITIQENEIEGVTYSVGTVAELPDVAVYEENYQDAYVAITQVIDDLKAIADQEGRNFPAPSEVKDEEFSGRATLRIPKSIHRKAAALAENEGVSLNQFFASTIAEAVGVKSAERLRPEPTVHLTSPIVGKVGVVFGKPKAVSGATQAEFSSTYSSAFKAAVVRASENTWHEEDLGAASPQSHPSQTAAWRYLQ